MGQSQKTHPRRQPTFASLRENKSVLSRVRSLRSLKTLRRKEKRPNTPSYRHTVPPYHRHTVAASPNRITTEQSNNSTANVASKQGNPHNAAAASMSSMVKIKSFSSVA